MRRRPFSVVCLIIILFIYLGTHFAVKLPSALPEWEGEKITAVGEVYQKECTFKAEKEQKILYLHLTSIEDPQYLADTDNKLTLQNIICYLKPDQELPEMGSMVKVEGKIKNFEKPSNPGQFDAESYYHILKISFQLNQTEIQAKSDTYDQFREKLYEYKEYFSGILDISLSDRDASVMKTMLLGEKSSADKEIKALYQRNGIAHILAISGLHISLLGMTLFKLLRRAGLPVWVTAGLPAVIILLYGFMTGFSVSSLRAVIMFMIHMTAHLCKRTYDMITAAFLAAVLLLLDQPLYLYSSSFLFSFGCIFAIGFLVPALTKEMKHREKEPGVLLTSFLSGAALTMAGIPLQLCFFYQMPVYATVLNLLVIPFMSFLMTGGILLLLFYKIPMISTLTASLITGILAVYETSCRFVERLPFHMILPGKPGKVQIGIYLAGMFTVIVLKERITLKKRWALLLCSAFLLFLPGKRELTVTFLDVGQGDCIHISTMEGSNYLIDGGSSSVSSVGTYRIIPYLKEKGADEIEALFVTHPDQDHCNGITELMQTGKEQGIFVRNLYLPDIAKESRSEAYEALVTEAERNGISVGYISKGQALIEDDFELICLHPEKGYSTLEANEFSTVLFLGFGDFQVLLTGDVEGEGEKKLLRSLYEADNEGTLEMSFRERGITVLKAAHHGSAGSTSEELLKLLHPAYTIISCGKNNSYGHPHKELLERLNEQKTEIMITYESGAITFHTDGKKMWVEEYLTPDQPVVNYSRNGQ
ncbi:MAG: DNA internalization-related competence protein ComEC/Rec2 [Lachnospiraceae bacterium]|nr:DNA internalization-related competence protein ComEC/Rec2 [Lachnospiraceae bacterium]